MALMAHHRVPTSACCHPSKEQILAVKSVLCRMHRRLEQEHSVEESFAVDVVDRDVQEAERLIQSAERHV